MVKPIKKRRGQVMLITALGMVIILAAFIPLFSYLQLSTEEIDSDFSDTVKMISFNFKEALTISLSEVSQAFELKSSARDYDYTSLEEYSTAKSIGYEFLGKWQNETSLQQSGLGLAMNQLNIEFECEWASSLPFRSSVNGTIEFNIPNYGFEGWKYNTKTESNLYILGLNEQDGENTSFFFRLIKDNCLPINDLGKAFIKIYYNKTDGNFQYADDDLTELYPIGEGKYLVKFNSPLISNPPCIKMILQDPRGIVVGAIPSLGVVLTVGEDNVGPMTLNLNYVPKPVQVNGAFTVTGIIDDTETGWSYISSAEYFVDIVGSHGTGTPMLAADGVFDSYTENVEATIDVSGWELGNYSIYVRGLDANGNWGNTREIIVDIVEEQYMYVYEIDMSYESEGFWFWIRVRGLARITIYDTQGYPVENANVYGTWSDATSDSDWSLTDDVGEVLVRSDWVWVFGSQDRTFTFTVDNVIKDGMNYDPDLNNETSDTVEYP